MLQTLEIKQRKGCRTMEEYTVITQGNAIYLEGKLGDEEQLDEVDRGMLVSNQISGFLPLSVQWVNGNCRLLYNITGLTPLEQAARILENETRLTNFFLSLCKAEKECDEYLLNPRKIDLEPGVVYLDADGKAFVLYRPVEAAGQKYDPMELTHFVFRLIGQQMPQDSRILNVLSRQLLYGGSFSFAELEPKLKEKPVMEKLPEPVQEETPRYEERHPIQAKPYVPPKPVMEPPKTEIPKQEPVVPEPAQDNPFAQSGNPFAEVQPKNEKPQKENKKAEKKPEKKSGGLFGLFGGKKDKKKAGSEEQENPFQQKEEPPQAAQKAEMPRAQRPAPVAAPMQAPAAPKAEAGRTVLLSGSENGGTAKTMVMGSGTTGAGELYLVQKDTNQYIHVTHTNFHIGRAENIVDYTVQTRNHYLENDHAYILLDGGNYYIVDGVALVFPEGDLRVHAHEFDVGAIVFTGSGAVEQLVVLLHQRNAPLGVLPDPVCKSVLDDLLFLLCQHGFTLVQHTFGLALGILDGVVDADILQVQGLLQNLVGVCSAGAVGLGGNNVAPPGGSLALHTPLGGIRRISHFDCMAQIVGNLEGLGHKLLDNVRVQPCGTQAHINFRGFQFSGLRLGQCLHIDGKLRVGLCRKLRHPQLCPDIAGQVFVCHLPARFRVGGVGGRVFEDHAGEFGGNAPILAGCAQQLRHIGQIHLAMFPNGHRQRFAGGIHAGDGALRANGALGEHRCLGFKLPLLVQIFQRTQQIVGGILLKQPPVFAVVQQTVFGGKGIVGGVQTLLRCLDVLVRVILQLLLNQLVDDLPQLHHASDTGFGCIGQLDLGHPQAAG